ncbi:MAG: ECF transporter S component [Aristaeellaceae bacterium]|nr:ECF transporter S component [Eubacteriales bacterium]
MLKRLAPFATVLLSVLLDTAILPVFYNGRFLLPLSLVVVILIGVQLGRTYGMLYGMIGGLLLDITTGTLGMKLFPYVLIGFLIGFLLDQQPEIDRSMERIERVHILMIRVIWISVLVALYEVVMLIFQYFSTAVFTWVYVGNLAIRVVLITALTQILHPAFHRLYIGRSRQAGGGRATREVKHF